MNKQEAITNTRVLASIITTGLPFTFSDKDQKKILGTLEYAVKVIKAQPDILDDEEKKYLGQVIRPYHNRIINITKRENQGESYIIIALKHFKNTSVDDICLPCFSAESGMYKGMKPNTKYTLDELGL